MFKPILIGVALWLSPVAFAPAAFAEKPVYTEAKSNTALQGYDAVAYFSMSKPVLGSAKYTVSYQGADFYFSSAANRDAFKANPAKFAPQYGGYCAWAVAQGKHAKGDARFWKIVDGKLYLNFNAGIQKKWEKDVPGFIARADKQWPEINK
jgi:YHS domain-containing protein